MDNVSVKALKSFVGSFDGIQSRKFVAGEIYEMPQNTAVMFADGKLVSFDLELEVEPDHSLASAPHAPGSPDADAAATPTTGGVPLAPAEGAATDDGTPADNDGIAPDGETPSDMSLADLKAKLGHANQGVTIEALEKAGYAEAKKGADMIPAEFVAKVLAATPATDDGTPAA